MIEALVPMLLPLASWLVLMGLASAAGLALVGAWPWAPRARAAGVALAAGLAAAPLLAGLAAVATLWALPGAAARTQVGVVFALLGAVAVAGWFTGSLRVAVPVGAAGVAGAPGADLVPRGPAAVLTWVFFAALLFDSLVVPLIQNDALEYATAARIVHDTRDLAAYPALQPQRHPSGFYGPWTHPPLYVALLALGFEMQGGSEVPLLMRFVAPWCLAGSAACVAALAQWANPARPGSGALAALLLVSAPMLFLGAASALIDTLPVLGLTLALTAVAGLVVPPGGRWWPRSIGIGVMLGLALWTHSQAVLVPLLTLPLLLLQGAGRRRERLGAAVKCGALALAVALLVGAAPYLRNIVLFGAPISDNPVIFALPSLDWPGYFRQQRGLASPGELVQYGLLKPWFAVEAYALVFWLALLAFVHRREPLPVLADEAQQVRTLALAVVGLYLAGAVLSVALGIDLMVRNERYMLILLPPAAIVAAGALTWPRWRGALVALIGLQLAVLVFYRLSQLNAERGAEGERLQRWGPYAATQYLRRDTPPASLVFSMKPADMFYAGRAMLSYLDPRLVPFYAERDPAAAAARLRALGVTHVHLPDYWLPPVYHSMLGPLLASPELAELAFEAHGYQIYRLRDATPGARPAEACGDVLPFDGWGRTREFVLGGRKNLRRIRLGTTPWRAGDESRAWNTSPLFLRETNTVLHAEVALPGAAPRLPAHDAPHAVHEWRLRLELEGDGYVQALVQPRGAGAAQQLVADRPLGAGEGVQVLQRRLRVDAAAQRVELRLEHRAASRLRVRHASLQRLCGPVPPAARR
ncbi:MAG: hypothetical protein KIT17_04995 [Rubrivivax sp.]|nr:hypothetical protein [Rubrivivax sp.]